MTITDLTIENVRASMVAEAKEVYCLCGKGSVRIEFGRLLL